jgi:hypothetical protein
MRYFQPPANTRFYAGVDLHANSLFLVVLDQQGQTRYAQRRRLPFPWKIFSLDTKSLRNSRAATRPDPPVNRGWPFASA